jgi:hypothetical protein
METSLSDLKYINVLNTSFDIPPQRGVFRPIRMAHIQFEYVHEYINK